MAYKILGQVQPPSTSNVDLYTVPADTEAVVSTLHLNNTAAVASEATVFVRKLDGTLAAAGVGNEFISSVLVGPGEPLSLTVGITLATGDTITVQTAVANTVTFHLFGSEIA